MKNKQNDKPLARLIKENRERKFGKTGQIKSGIKMEKLLPTP